MTFITTKINDITDTSTSTSTGTGRRISTFKNHTGPSPLSAPLSLTLSLSLFLTWGLGTLSKNTWALDNYPSHAIRIVVPFAPGGGGDFIARSFSDKLSEVLAQPVLIDNKGGGNTVVGTEIVSKAVNDGYTLGLVSTSLATNPSLMPQMPYRTPDDFAPVSLVITYPFGLAARLGLGVSTVSELIAYARQNPGQLSMATSGDGSGSHLAALMLQEALASPLVMVTYRGAGPAINDVAAGHVDLLFTGMSQIKPLADAKRLKILASSGINRIQSEPDIKTISEQGIKGFNAVVWWGMIAPAGTPPAVVDKLNAALKVALSRPEVAKRLQVVDGEVSPSTPQEFDHMIRQEVLRWKKLLVKSPAKSE
jgi:tripartite-type tricarboxylate transporter receptor subunit TctC